GIQCAGCARRSAADDNYVKVVLHIKLLPNTGSAELWYRPNNFSCINGQVPAGQRYIIYLST
ncbi:MAG: hypothetical protein ACYSR5_12340, partial [Planctomycetota bacterium]